MKAMKVKSAKTNSQGFNINEIIYDVDQVVAFIYAALCGLWFVYIIIDIFITIKKKTETCQYHVPMAAIVIM